MKYQSLIMNIKVAFSLQTEAIFDMVSLEVADVFDFMGYFSAPINYWLFILVCSFLFKKRLNATTNHQVFYGQTHYAVLL